MVACLLDVLLALEGLLLVRIVVLGLDCDLLDLVGILSVCLFVEIIWWRIDGFSVIAYCLVCFVFCFGFV